MAPLKLFKPMLSESTTVDRLPDYAQDDRWWFEQKVDGHRLVTIVKDGHVTFLNRSGDLKSTLPHAHLIQPEFERLTVGEWCFDGEIVDNVYWLFDLPYVVGKVNLDDEYQFRRTVLDHFFSGWAPNGGIKLLPYTTSPASKILFASKMEDTGREGVMVKDKTAGYQPGKRSKKCLKAKFTKTVDCVVTKVGVGGKENAELGLWKVAPNGVNRWLMPVGGCSTIGKPTVVIGDVVEVKYLYANDPKAPRLYQPTILRKRDDKPAEDCLMDQLYYADKSIFL